MEILIAIGGVLLGVIGILGGVLNTQLQKNKTLKQQVKTVTNTNTANEKITDVVTQNKIKKDEVLKKNGTLFLILIFISFYLYGCAGIETSAVAPNIVVINYNLEPVSYEYNDTLDLFTFTPNNMNNLVYNINLLNDTVAKYEKQISIYNDWRKKL